MRQAFGQQFDIAAGYLNTASVGIPPVAVADAVGEAVNRWRRGQDASDAFDVHVSTARSAFAQLVGVPTSSVTMGAGAAQLVGLVAASVPDGSRVLVAGGDFTSVTFPFAAQAHRGVTLTEVALGELVSRVDGHDLVAVSVVQSADGAVLDLAGLRAAAEAAGARVLLDVSQAAGWLPLELGWADWVVGAAYKWLLSPRGAAWLASAPDALDLIVPNSANWFGGEDPWTSIYGLPLRLADDARRLDISPVWFAQLGAAASLSWLATLDLAAVRAHCVGLANGLLAGLGLPQGDSSIVSLAVPGAAERLRAAGAVFAQRDGRVRLAFHLYNTEEDVDLALAAMS
ncbi:aminotransferase class V-fold PLP-dependent enzyme [Solihabitans fulvus]|uniref:Aminotransferase class V-fold PLP-dependent enzyme n=1 Tax=Solihabitans fulvus TaxID=1892852 RepID=A0A5B2X6Q1_9PSEU|nr:aminotransferase class V-fold PLP-dependent enzyme [Solihabitans fulvus]KAA2258592.1 aminotransferase class V-fold PLP-dependent enzyme [Solihabitans fulvus]